MNVTLANSHISRYRQNSSTTTANFGLTPCPNSVTGKIGNNKMLERPTIQTKQSGEVMSVGKEGDAPKVILQCTRAALEKKAKDIIVLNVKELSSFADYLIICSGRSDRQVKAIASSIEENLKKSRILPLGIEGEKSGKWVLMDYNDIVIHIFYEPTREFYNIERLWPDAPRIKVGDIDYELSADI